MGKIIVIEGTECSSKEKQSKLLVRRLQEKNIKCVYFDFPHYDSPTGKIIEGPYLGKKSTSPSYFEEGSANVDPHIACLYYAADRKYNIKKIEEYLKKDYYVIIDRYTTSNMAHQGGKILDDDERFLMYQWIDKLEFWLLRLPKPDFTIFLHMPYEFTYKLLEEEEQKKAIYKDLEHLKNYEKAYIELSELYNWDRIECVEEERVKSIEEVHEEIISILKKSIRELN